MRAMVLLHHGWLVLSVPTLLALRVSAPRAAFWTFSSCSITPSVMLDRIRLTQRVFAVKLMRQIATSSAKQADGLGQINQAVAMMDGVTQQNAAPVEEASAAAAALREQAPHPTQLVGRFRLGT